MKNKRFLCASVGVVIFLLVCNESMAETNIKISFLPDKAISKIDKKLFGTSMLGWEIDHGRGKKINGLGSNYCYGLWDAKEAKYVKEPFELANGIKIGSVRLIGQFTDWEKGVDGFGNKEYAFGLNEQLRFVQDIGAEPIICLANLELEDSYVALFKYLRMHYPDIKYVEIGNESYGILSSEEYAKRYLFYYELIKGINPDLKIGFVGRDMLWEKDVLSVIGDHFDFIVEHYYIHGGRNNDSGQEGNAVFASLFSKVEAIERKIKDTLNLMDEIIGERKPIAVTEYNAWFVQEKPVPYRHTLGTALINAELMRIFMKPENNILTANIWNLINEYWGMIANGFNGDYRTLNNFYYKRPNYLVFEMYSNYFGDYLINADIMFTPEVNRENELIGHQWVVRKFDGVDVRSENDNVELNFTDPSKFNYYHTAKVVDVKGDTEYRLSGYLKTENFQGTSGICLEIQDGRGWTKTKSAVTTQKISGTVEWTHVETYYKTLPDAESIKIIVRRIGETGPLAGKVFVKNVVLEQIGHMDVIKEDDLSVNASTNENGDAIYLMVTNKNVYKDVIAEIDLNNFVSNGSAEIHYLWAKRVDDTNERRPNNDVRIYKDTIKVDGDRFVYKFKKHSLTAFKLERNE